MSITDAQWAIMDRIATISEVRAGDAHVAWPDGKGADLPRYVMQAAGGAQQTRTIRGLTQADPEVVVRVETEEADYGHTSRDLVNALAARFPVTLRFSGLTILQAPDVRPALPSAGAYVVPVIIRARTYF